MSHTEEPPPAVARRRGCWRPITFVALALAATTLVVAVLVAVGVTLVSSSFPDGRPLRRHGWRRCPPRTDGCRSGWQTRAAHEGVAAVSFEHVADQLEAVGAPGSLVHRSRRAADDERRHTTVALLLAGIDAEPGAVVGFDVPEAPRPPRSELERRCRVARLGVEALVDGMRDEARAAARLEADAATLRACGQHVRSRLVAAVARDERGHVELNADIVAWSNGALGPIGRRCLPRRPLVS